MNDLEAIRDDKDAGRDAYISTEAYVYPYAGGPYILTQF